MQIGYQELGVPRSELADYLNSGKLREGDGYFFRPQYSLDVQRRVAREKLLILTGAPYITEQSRAAMMDAQIIADPVPDGFTSETSMGDLVDPISGAIAGATLTAEAMVEDLPDPGTCSDANAVGTLVCSLFYASAIMVVAGGAVVGAGVGAINQAERHARKKMADNIRRDLGDVRPLAELMAAFNAEFRSGTSRADPQLVNGAVMLDNMQVPAALNRDWLVDGDPVIGADDIPARLALSSVPIELATSGRGNSLPVLAIGMDRFGLYPVREDGKLKYSLAIVADLTFIRRVSADARAGGDEVVLRVSTEADTFEYVFQNRKFPVIRPPHQLEEWQEDPSSLMAAELDAAIQNAAERMVDYSVRLYRTELKTGLPAVYRLSAIDPTNRIAGFGDDLASALNPFRSSSASQSAVRGHVSAVQGHQTGCLPARPGSVRPMLRWSTVPQTAEGAPLDLPVEQMRYDLRIFDGGLRETMRADGLDVPSFEIPHPLEADSLYYWTVRARFEIDGEERITDWALCNSGRIYPHVFDEAPLLYNPIITPGR